MLPRATPGSATMTSDEILFDAEERMDKAVEHFRDELRGLRAELEKRRGV